MGGGRPPEGKGDHLSGGGLAGLRVVLFESRRAAEMAELVRRHGGEPVSAPSMREVPPSENPVAIDFARRLGRGEIDVVVHLTGVGTRHLAAAIAAEMPREAFGRALAAIVTVARGPKPIAALKELGVRPTIAVPEPNTWRELLAEIDAHGPIGGKRVAVQEYGEPNPELLDGLAARGAEVLRVPVYRWALPEDTRPLVDAISRLLSGSIDVALFTTATQVEHLFRLAGDRRALASAFSRVAVGSIGPIASEALRGQGVEPDFGPDHPKMGQLVLAAAERARGIVAVKRRA